MTGTCLDCGDTGLAARIVTYARTSPSPRVGDAAKDTYYNERLCPCELETEKLNTKQATS